MATNSNYVCVQTAVVSIGAWVANAGATTLTDVGHTSGPVELGSEFENFDVESDRTPGIIKTVPIKAGFTLKIPMLEVTAELLRTAMRLATGQVSGTGDNKTVAVSDPAEQYHRVQLVTQGVGTTRVRTITAWKCQVLSVDPIQYGKAVAQSYVATLRMLRDDSITAPTTDGYFYKQVDA